ncbi:Neuropeptide SIFamide [Frankliniella fusca]|uniref:Neuropeptide SIFamide n=1 Tax=Frankliniella fusca TaxID=407009 RepID=A0AAE1L8U7_9NEOP|nr:Neuropeptide SIFamide [Frankliniella fusca]
MQLRTLVAVFLLSALVLLAGPAAATFRKPPFNGSIFGKRGAPDQARSMAEVDTTANTMNALCAVATEACNGWYSADN